ncbi:hypothetical protein WN944_009698 [Citrus x changshan-huyou]|uniref:Uncharacterized protein n=1 Tax=Citrus x changshan-huyou TaxID=2935761 RepID=A0AAP0MWM8_9ROSI
MQPEPNIVDIRYLHLSNMYADAGKWDEASWVRASIKSGGKEESWLQLGTKS